MRTVRKSYGLKALTDDVQIETGITDGADNALAHIESHIQINKNHIIHNLTYIGWRSVRYII